MACLINSTERLEVVIEFLSHRLLRRTDRKRTEKKRQIERGQDKCKDRFDEYN